MGKLFRFGVSLDKELLKNFDKLIKSRRYTNRSKAISDLIRQEFVKEQWLKGGNIAGAITLVYNHHRRELVNNITNIQHDFRGVIVSTQHIHLDHDNCLEIIGVRGKVAVVRRLADTLKSLKGVKHETLSMSTTGKNV